MGLLRIKTLSVGIFGIMVLSACAEMQVEGASPIDVAVLSKTGMSWNGDALPAYPKGEPEVTILKITVAPKTRLPMHMHPVINAGVLLSGKLTVVMESGETLYLKAGDSIVELVEKWHYGKNEGDEPAEIIVFYAGVKGTPITIKKAQGQ